MNKNPQAQLRQHLITLKLPSISRLYEETARIAEQNSLSYEEFLAELIEQEIVNRKNNTIARNMKDSALPPEKTLEMLDRSLLPKKVQRQISSIMTGEFLDRKENLLFFGNPGTGKTHLACAIGEQMIQKGRRVKFYTTGKLVEHLLVQKQSLRFTKALKMFAKYDAIILDDIGYVQQNQAEMEVLFTFLAERYEQASVIITSNLQFSHWEKIFKDKMTTAAAIDRLVHHCVIIELNTESYRVNTANQRATGDTTDAEPGYDKAC